MANLNSNYAAKQLLAGYGAIIFGSLGIHKFILGYTAEGILTIIISILGGYFSYGFTLLIMQVVGLVEGIIYLNKSHEEFIDNYFTNKQGWFWNLSKSQYEGNPDGKVISNSFFLMIHDLKSKI